MTGDEITFPEMSRYPDVSRSEITLAAPDGTVPATLFTPQLDHPAPAVAIGAEAYGPNDFSARIGATLAHLGHVTIVPDFYRGEGPSDPENYTDFEEVIAHIGALDFDRATADLRRGLDHLAQMPEVDSSRLVVWGYCTGGTLAMLNACTADDLAAAVLFFPSQPRLGTAKSTSADPIDLASSISCPTIVVIGELDPVWPADLVGELRRQLERAGVEHEVRLYPDAGHAFSAPVPPMQNAEADRASWRDVISFLNRHI